MIQLKSYSLLNLVPFKFIDDDVSPLVCEENPLNPSSNIPYPFPLLQPHSNRKGSDCSTNALPASTEKEAEKGLTSIGTAEFGGITTTTGKKTHQLNDIKAVVEKV